MALKSPSNRLSYEALSAAYETVLINETPDERELSEVEIQRRKLFDSEANSSGKAGQHNANAGLPGEGATLPRNAMRLKRVTEPEEEFGNMAPREQLVAVHNTLLAAGTLAGIEEDAKRTLDVDDTKTPIQVAMMNVLRIETISKLELFCAHIEQQAQSRLLLTDSGYLNAMLIRKLLVDLSSIKLPDVLISLLKVLGQLMRAPENASTALEASVVELVSSLMQRNAAEALLQAEGCRVLSQAANVDCGLLWAEDTHMLVFRALELHGYDPEVVEQGLALLWCLAMDPSGPTKLCEFSNRLQLLVSTLDAHHENPRIAEAFAGVIWEVCTCSENSVAVAKAGALDSLTWAVEMHRECASTVEICQGAVWQLARLGMAERLIGSSGVAWGIQSLQWHAQHLPGLEYRSLGSSPLWEATVKALLSETKLERLKLNGCGLRNQEVEYLGAALAENISVTEVDLSNNRIEDNGAHTMAVALGQQRIAKLSLRGNMISDEGGAMLCNSAAMLHHVVQLDLTGNLLSKAMMNKIAHAVEDNVKYQDDLILVSKVRKSVAA